MAKVHKRRKTVRYTTVIQPLCASSLLLLVLVTAVGSEAQQSYRSYQQLSGRVLTKSERQNKNLSDLRSLPTRFKGWNHKTRLRSDYVKHFSRPRARAARAHVLENAASAASHDGHPFAQFAPSALPGFQFRDSLPAGFIPTAVATGDFNGDGKLDFVVANGGDNNLWLYFGKGDGTFSLPIILPVTLGQSPVWVATGDLRAIGRTDIVAAEADSNSVGIFLSNGDGTFVESAVALPGSATFLLLGDFNHDGKLDVVAPMDDSNPNFYVSMLPGLGDGTFGTPVNTPDPGDAPAVFWASSADLNGDGYPDLLLISNAIEEIAVQVFLNNKDGTFSAGQVVAQDSLAVGVEYLSSLLFDADGDGITDAVLSDYLGILSIYHGNGDGTFSTTATQFAIGDVAFVMAAADVNGDGYLDVIASGAYVGDSIDYGIQAGDQICVLEGDGKGNFSPPKVYRGDSSSFSLAVADFNGDGHPDVVTANQENDSATVFLNDGTGGYGAPQGYWVGYEGNGPVNAPLSQAVMLDVDGNGTIDVVFLEWNPTGDNNYQLTALLNDGSGNLSPPVRSDAVNSTYGGIGDFVLADFRNTGSPDFLAIGPNCNCQNPSFISFAPNTGGGHFGPPTGTTPPNATGIIGVGDFNRDGKLDFVAAGYGIGNDINNVEGIQVFLGNGNGTFTTGYVQTFGGKSEQYPVAVYVGDFNRDGNLDLLVFMESNGGWTTADDLYEFLGNGDGTFQTGKLLFSNFGPMVVADVDGDGYPDIVNMLFPISTISISLPNPVQFSIYIGQPDGTFALTNTYTPYGYSPAFAQPPYSPMDGKYAPLVADFNGDGKLDIAAFQQIGEQDQDKDTFVHFLLGNGDGTFTPTYDVFDFRKPFVDAYAVDLMGTGRPQFFELNGYRSTYNILAPIVAPPFQFSLVGDPVSGPQGSGIILLDVPSTTSTALGLSASDPAITVPATVTIPAGSVSQTFDFTIAPTFNANHVFAITAQLGTGSAAAYGTAVASGAAGFQVQNGSGFVSNFNLGPGQSGGNYELRVLSVNGYTTTVTAQCMGLSAIAQCEMIPPNFAIRPGDIPITAMFISVHANAPQGSYTATVQVTDGVLTQDMPFTLNVGDFSMSLSPQTLQVLPSGNGAYQLTVGSSNQFDQAVTLTCGGLPTGATCSTLPFTYPPTGGTPVSVGVQTQSVPAGNYQITVTGTSSPITHAAVAQLQVSDFSPSLSPTSATVKPGGSATFNVTVAPVNGFNGTVNFSCLSSSALISGVFNPSSMSVPANGTATSVLTLTASSQATSSRKGQLLVNAFQGPLLIGLSLALVASFTSRRMLQKSIAFASVLTILCIIPSCGGGGGSNVSSGGGGGGNSQTFSINVQVTAGLNTTKSAGTITLTVN